MAPANDTAAGAIPLALNIPADGTLALANNDYNLTGATATQFTGQGQTTSTAPGRDVVYRFTAPAAGSYSVRVNFANVADYVLYAASALTPGTVTSTTLQASNRNATAANAAEELFNLTLAAGQQVFLVVDANSAADAGGTFRIEVAPAVGEGTSNDTPATATPYAFGVEGAINVSTDRDYFSLGTPAADARVFAMTDTAAGSVFDSFLRVTTSTQTLEWDDDDGDGPYGTASSVIAGTIVPVGSGPVFLQVAPFSTNTFEPYRLYAVVQGPSGTATPEADPGGTGNNTIAAAVAATSNYFSGDLAAASDVDFFAIGAVAGDLLFVALDCDPLRNGTPVDLTLALLDAAGNVLVSVNGITGISFSSTVASPASLEASNPFTSGEGLAYRIATAGNYYVRVTGAAAGDYLLSISKNGLTGGGGVAPSVGGLTAAPQVVNDSATVVPFAAATVSASSPVAVIVTYTAANGVFGNLGGFRRSPRPCSRSSSPTGR
jgi:hypothetical protein